MTLAALPSSIVEPYRLGRFAGAHTTIGTMREMIKGQRGERSLVVYKLTEHCVRYLQGKDYLSELIAIRNFVAEHVRYKNDPLSTEWVSDPQRLAEQIMQHGRATADCDDISGIIATMVRQVGRESDLVTVGFGKPGQYSHVFARAYETKAGRWIVLDPVAGTDEGKMLRRVTTYKIWKLD